MSLGNGYEIMSGLIGTVRHRATLAAPNWAGDKRRGKIGETRRGVTNHFAVTSIIWKRRSFARVWERLIGLAKPDRLR